MKEFRSKGYVLVIPYKGNVQERQAYRDTKQIGGCQGQDWEPVSTVNRGVWGGRVGWGTWVIKVWIMVMFSYLYKFTKTMNG